MQQYEISRSIRCIGSGKIPVTISTNDGFTLYPFGTEGTLLHVGLGIDVGGASSTAKNPQPFFVPPLYLLCHLPNLRDFRPSFMFTGTATDLRHDDDIEDEADQDWNPFASEEDYKPYQDGRREETI
ncbi:MAG: hypothetical protein ACC700_18040 [Anaerolineales bacterium]